MQDILTMMNRLRRPRLLIRAARYGAEEYRRDKHLQRLLGYGRIPRSGAALLRLIELERAQNQLRCDSDASYSLTRHLDILIAVIGEARLLQASQI